MGESLGAVVTRMLAIVAEESEVAQVTLERKTGIGQSQISRSFAGYRVLSIDEADALCTALGVSFPQVIRDARALMDRR